MDACIASSAVNFIALAAEYFSQINYARIAADFSY